MQSKRVYRKRRAENRQVQNNKKKTPLDKIKNWLPIAYPIILFLGIVNQHIYYSFFNIKITAYLDVSEVLLVLFDDFISALFYIFVGLVAQLLLSSLFSSIINFFKPKSQDVIAQYFIIHGLPMGIITIATMAILPIFFPSLDFTMIEIFACLSGVFLALELSLSDSEKSISFSYPVYLLVFAFLANPYVKKEKVLSGQYDIEVITKFDTLVIKDNYKLIGETKNYLFVYDSLNLQTRTVKRSDIKSIKTPIDSDPTVIDILKRFHSFLSSPGK